jgi:DNA-binding LytR/AlgR family response regulator
LQSDNITKNTPQKMRILEKLQDDSIFYLQSDINYTIIHCCDGSTMISSFTLKKHEVALKEQNFLRINKSQLVNQKFIESIELQNRFCLIKLTNGLSFRSSRRKVGLVKTSLN